MHSIETPEEELTRAIKTLDELTNEYYLIKHRFKYGSTLKRRIQLRGSITDQKQYIKELKGKIKVSRESEK